MALDAPIKTQGLHRPKASRAKKWFVPSLEFEKVTMFGLMQQQSLLISSLIEFADRHHGDGEVDAVGRVQVAVGPQRSDRHRPRSALRRPRARGTRTGWRTRSRGCDTS